MRVTRTLTLTLTLLLTVTLTLTHDTYVDAYNEGNITECCPSTLTPMLAAAQDLVRSSFSSASTAAAWGAGECDCKDT